MANKRYPRKHWNCGGTRNVFYKGYSVCPKCDKYCSKCDRPRDGINTKCQTCGTVLVPFTKEQVTDE